VFLIKKMQSSLAFHLEAITQSLNLLAKKPLANAMTILVIAVALALPGFFWVFADNLSQASAAWQRSGHLSLYLKPASASAQNELMQLLQKIPAVGQATLKSPAEGLSELIKQEGMHDIMRYLPENPLPAVIDILPAVTVESPSQLQALVKQVQGLPHVDQVKLDMAWITRLHALLHLATQFAHALMVSLALAVILIISTTLRLALHNRREEIQVLKLIGASDSFILRPYLYLGIGYGATGAMIAVLLVDGFVFTTDSLINQMAAVYEMHYSLLGMSIRQILLLLVFAIILGGLAARLSVRGQLQSIEPSGQS
jgi:cell division transport system permease protein